MDAGVAGVDTAQAANRAEHLRAAVSRAEVDWHGQPLGTITASFGVATDPAHADSATELIRAADAAMYEAQRTARDCVTAYTPSLHAS